MTLRLPRAALLALAWMGCSSVPGDPSVPALRGKADDPACASAIPPLACVAVPQPSGSDIADAAAAVRLGKALFWDLQVASDGYASCASCHFRAGSDPRTINTLHPGPNGIFESGGVTAAGQLFHGGSLATDDRVGSQGMVAAQFQSIPQDLAQTVESCAPKATQPWGPNRQVTTRRVAPTNGAVFNRVQFRDGRAEGVFNGFDPFGDSGNATRPQKLFDLASLASQAVGPPVNPEEMSCDGRPFNGAGSLAEKLLPRAVLQFQWVAVDDGVFAPVAAYPDKGLKCQDHPCTYREMVAAAFVPALVKDAQNEFSRIFGQAIQAYLATLVPDQTPYDRFLEGDQTALTQPQQLGLEVFVRQGGCARCHAGTELSDATVGFAVSHGLMGPTGNDQGFHNTGVRPTAEDLGRATVGPRGVSYSKSGSPYDRGAFKTPQLRNVGLRAPYFHNGGKATLAEVVDFYARGGDFANPEKDPMLGPRTLSDEEKAALVDFLQNGLTDCRVQKERAPFDHPYIVPPNWGNIEPTGAGGLGPCP